MFLFCVYKIACTEIFSELFLKKLCKFLHLEYAFPYAR